MRKNNHKTERNARSESDFMLIKSLLPSVLCIVLCAVLFCGITFAWLNNSVSGNSSAIVAGNFAVNVTIGDEEGFAVPLSGQSARLYEGTYTVQLQQAGTSPNGYALMILGGETYMIESFPVTFTVKIDAAQTEGVAIGFLPHWGNKPTATPVITAGMQIEP